MGIESFDNNSHIVNKSDIANLKATEKEKKFFERIFDKIDTDRDGKLDYDKEGTICIFEDGAVSAMKNKSVSGSKIESIFIGGRSADGRLEEVNDDLSTSYYFKDGSAQTIDKNGVVREGNLKNGTKFKNITDESGQLLYKEYTTRDGKKFLLSPDNKRFAYVEPDGTIRTNPVPGDSIYGTFMRMGITDPELLKELREVNKHAGVNKHDYFSINWEIDHGDVIIPAHIAKTLDITRVLADNHNMQALIDKLNEPAPAVTEQAEIPAAENEEAATEEEAATGNETRKAALEEYAKKERTELKEVKAQPAIAKPQKEEQVAPNPATDKDSKVQKKQNKAMTKAQRREAKEQAKAQKREQKAQAKAEAMQAKELKKAQKRARKEQAAAEAQAEKDAKAAQKAMAVTAKKSEKVLKESSQYAVDDKLREKIHRMTPYDIAKCRNKKAVMDTKTNRYVIGDYSGVSQNTVWIAYVGTRDYLMTNHAKYKALAGKESLTDDEKAFISGYETRFCRFMNATE